MGSVTFLGFRLLQVRITRWIIPKASISHAIRIFLYQLLIWHTNQTITLLAAMIMALERVCCMWLIIMFHRARSSGHGARANSGKLDRNLTDEDGPYIELMTGVYTDMSYFTWLQPYEEKSFTQYFMPYKNIGVMKNATIDAAVNLEVDEATKIAVVQAYATSVFVEATIEVKSSRRIYLRETLILSPTDTFKSILTIDETDQAHQIKVTIRAANGVLLNSYQPKKEEIEQIPDAAKPLPAPEELKSIEQLYLAGLHLEQYRHATFEPEAYYLEGLKRDSSDIRIKLLYGILSLCRGQFTESEADFRKAVQAVSWRNTNPYDSEAHYQLGVSLKQQGRLEEAFTVFYKAVWSAAWQDSGYYSLAQIACWKESYAEALELVERSLIRNTRNYKARHLKDILASQAR